jgi:hypothetical protein
VSTTTTVDVHCDGRPAEKQACPVWIGFGRSIRDARRHARAYGWFYGKGLDQCAGCKPEPEPACSVCGARRVRDAEGTRTLLMCSYDTFHGGVLAPGLPEGNAHVPER